MQPFGPDPVHSAAQPRNFFTRRVNRQGSATLLRLAHDHMTYGLTAYTRTLAAYSFTL